MNESEREANAPVTAQEIADILANEKITQFGGTITYEGPKLPPPFVPLPEITNPAWTLDAGRYVSDITTSSRNGGKTLYDPWDRVIPNDQLVPVYRGDGIEREVAGWDLSLTVDLKEVKAHLFND